MFKYLLLSLFFSCTTIHYKNDGVYRSYLKSKKNYINLVKIKEIKEFYFWGLIPSSHEIDLSDLLQLNGIKANIANLKISEYQTFSQTFQQFISLGLFVPKTVEVSGYVDVR